MVMRRRPGRMFFRDTVLVNKIVDGHEHDQAIDYDVKSLLHLVEDITKGYPVSSEGVSTLSGYNNMLEVLSYEINKISSELFFKALSGADAHLTTLSILKLVRTYKWDVKLVLTLAAFALTYGKYWQLAHIDSSKQLPKSLEILKQLPGVMEQYAGSSKPRFDALNILLEVILDVTKCVIEFNDLPHSYITPEVADYSSTASNDIPIAAYWSIRTIVFCATKVTFFTTLRDESVVSTTKTWELSLLSLQLKNILDHLRKQLDSCYRHIEKKKDDEAYGMLVELFQRCHLDNMKILRALIYAKDDILPLVDGSTKKWVSLDVLRRKTVLLLISGLDFPPNALSILEQIYFDSRKEELGTQFEIVWLPIVEQQSNEWNGKGMEIQEQANSCGFGPLSRKGSMP
ncbi:hypothetical protein L6164_005046 [Bauhinia variegata]|uniref:Uncharacterized protein n=1 Tax=Bauhinia variegata TaxID=167791 RepID=A0ACB9PQ27_BAUVA|nr:hypothetical protein L6164_005046 [Bauhinia variegata]